MRKKVIIILVSMLFIFTTISINVFAGSEEDPEIEDEIGDAFGYIDIESVWFYEKSEVPDVLYICMKINNASYTTFQQTFAVFWEYKDVKYAVSLHMGFSFKNWSHYTSGVEGRRDYINDPIEGDYDFDTGIITWRIPKDNIGNPVKDELLTGTWSNAFRRLGFIGRIGFTRYGLDALILRLFGNYMWDYAPERGEYGNNYIIQY
jgi:hypothetical protein